MYIYILYNTFLHQHETIIYKCVWFLFQDYQENHVGFNRRFRRCGSSVLLRGKISLTEFQDFVGRMGGAPLFALGWIQLKMVFSPLKMVRFMLMKGTALTRSAGTPPEGLGTDARGPDALRATPEAHCRGPPGRRELRGRGGRCARAGALLGGSENGVQDGVWGLAV